MTSGRQLAGCSVERSIALFAACLLLLFGSSAAAASQRAVAGSNSAAAIQAAINDARPGDTLLVPAGTYSGNIVIHKRLAVLGVGRPVLHGSGTGSVVTVTADSCIFEGFTVEHSGSMLVNEDAGILLKSAHSLVRNNELRDILFGIYLLHPEGNSIDGNCITGRKQLELGERGSGIHIWNSEHNRFTGNRITDVRDGFYIQNASHSWIEANEAYGVRYGLHYMYADSNTFLGNSFHHNVAGAAVMYSRGIVMRNNVFAHNRGFSSFGILFQDCHGLRADSNVVTDNVIGMFFEASTDNSFLHNVVAQNDIALQIFQNSANNSFLENNFIDNLNPLSIVGKRTESRWSVNGKGNYWSGYDGYDLDGDGIGDIPMKIQNVFQYIEGQNANVRIYLYSPASQALAVASKAFPIIRINEESDDRPLMRPFDMSEMPAVRMAGSQTQEAVPDAAPKDDAWIATPLLLLVAAGFLTHRLTRRSA